MTSTIDTTDLILKKIKNLPPLPLVVQKLIAVMEDENSCANDISEVLSCDQALAGKVLKLVNSSFFGHSGQVSTITRAVVILGMGPLRNLALGMSLAKLLPKPGEDGVQESFWAHAMACAAASEVLARESGYPDPEEVFIAGLLHDIGQLILRDALPQEYAQYQAQGSRNMLEDEKRLLGLPHTTVGQKLMKHWKLPAHLGQVARFHHTTAVFNGKDDPLVSLVTLADAMAQACVGAMEYPMDDSDFLDLIQRTGIDMTRAKEILQAVKERIEDTKLFLQIALDGELETGPAAETTPLTCVVICSDPVKVNWLQELLAYHGHRLLTMKEFFSQADLRDQTDLIVVDPGSVDATQLQKMAPRLVEQGERVVRLGQEASEDLDRALERELGYLSLVFSQDDLNTQE